MESVCTHLFVDVSQLMNKNRLCVISMEYSLYMTLHQLLMFWCSANNINCDKKCSYLYRGWVDPSVRRPSKLLQDCILDKIPFRIQQVFGKNSLDFFFRALSNMQNNSQNNYFDIKCNKKSWSKCILFWSIKYLQGNII